MQKYKQNSLFPVAERLELCLSDLDEHQRAYTLPGQIDICQLPMAKVVSNVGHNFVETSTIGGGE